MLLEALHSDTSSVDVVRTSAGLCALRDEWDALWSAADEATPFQSPDWLIPWWESFGCGELCVFTWREHGRLVAIVPLYFDADEAGGTVRLLGGGVGDYLDVICANVFREPVLSGLVEWLARRDVPWHRCVFDGLRDHSPFLAPGFGARCRDSITAGPPCPCLALRGGVRSTRLAQNLAQDRRRVGRTLGETRVTPANEESFGELFAVTVGLHGARWRDSGQSGVFAESSVRTFHERAARGLMRAGRLRLYVLWAGGKPVASYYGFLHRNRAYYYVGGFDPDARRFGVGNQIVAHAMAEAEREGAVEFDFLRGAEPYKYRWGAENRPTFCRTLFHPIAEGAR